MKQVLAILLLIGSLSSLSAQYPIFATDTSAVSDTDTLTGQWINLGRPALAEGRVSLFVIGDKLSGTQSKQLQVEVQTRSGKGPIVNNLIASQWQFLDSVATTYLDVTLADDGTTLSGYWIDVADKASVWNKFQGIRARFFFVGGTHKTRLLSWFEIN